ncbi:MAG: hypothetical protein AAFO83_11100, partial [Cyanobacteria bacterium J06607_13]
SFLEEQAQEKNANAASQRQKYSSLNESGMASDRSTNFAQTASFRANRWSRHNGGIGLPFFEYGHRGSGERQMGS